MTRWILAIAGLGLALCSCVRQATQLAVVIDSDLAPPPACVIVEVQAVGTEDVSSALFFVDRAGTPDVDLPFSFGVPASSPSQRVEIRARALSQCTTEPAAADVLVARTVRTGFLPQKTVAIHIALTSACVGVVCSPDQTCDAGRCVAVPTLEPTELDVITPFTGAELVDAGTASTVDAASAADAGCAESPCRLVAPQCGCGAGMGCYADPTGSVASCMTEGTSPLGGRCAAEADCRAGATCLTAPAPTTGNTCASLCDVPSACPGGTSCLSLAAPGFPTLGVCTSDCDPIDSSGCPSGRTCFLVRYTSPSWILQCVDAPGTAPEGGGCVGAADCVAHHVCADSACRHLCVLATGDGCSAGRTCMPSTSGAIRVGTTDYGVCVP